jgi:hypothetical protein
VRGSTGLPVASRAGGRSRQPARRGELRDGSEGGASGKGKTAVGSRRCGLWASGGGGMGDQQRCRARGSRPGARGGRKGQKRGLAVDKCAVETDLRLRCGVFRMLGARLRGTASSGLLELRAGREGGCSLGSTLKGRRVGGRTGRDGAEAADVGQGAGAEDDGRAARAIGGAGAWPEGEGRCAAERESLDGGSQELSVVVRARPLR